MKHANCVASKSAEGLVVSLASAFWRGFSVMRLTVPQATISKKNQEKEIGRCPA